MTIWYAERVVKGELQGGSGSYEMVWTHGVNWRTEADKANP